MLQIIYLIQEYCKKKLPYFEKDNLTLKEINHSINQQKHN